MAKINAMAIVELAGAFTGTGQSGAATIRRDFNVALWGTFVGTAQLERSFDGGTTWLPCSFDGAGTIAAYSAPVSLVAMEPEAGVNYRWNCTAFTSGTINFRISQ